MRKPCLTCGVLSEDSRCPTHTTQDRTLRNRKYPKTNRAKDAEYDAAWRRLSARARKMQRYCSDCGATEDLTADHRPEAWKAKAEGKPITLLMLDVLCRSCNGKKGSSKPGSERAHAA
jgi:5-methylcytosine-specific restriction protein A